MTTEEAKKLKPGDKVRIINVTNNGEGQPCIGGNRSPGYCKKCEINRTKCFIVDHVSVSGRLIYPKDCKAPGWNFYSQEVERERKWVRI